MLKPDINLATNLKQNQPPSGGCVLKPKSNTPENSKLSPAAFRRLCVETQWGIRQFQQIGQPPSGGCVLKLNLTLKMTTFAKPAAFRRLCVETSLRKRTAKPCQPAAFRRLCVETYKFLKDYSEELTQPPSGGCVLKPLYFLLQSESLSPSRLQAAVC